MRAAFSHTSARCAMHDPTFNCTVIMLLRATIAVGIFCRDFLEIDQKRVAIFQRMRTNTQHAFQKWIAFCLMKPIGRRLHAAKFNAKWKSLFLLRVGPNRNCQRLRGSQRFSGPPPTLFGGRSVAKKKSAKKGAKKAAKKGTKKKGAKKKKKSAKKV